MQSVWHDFVQVTMRGESGVFFVINDPIYGKGYYYCGMGDYELVDFETPVFPKFVLTDWLGRNQKCLYFSDFKEGFVSELVDDCLEDLECLINFEGLLQSNDGAVFREQVKWVKSKSRAGEVWVLNLAHNFIRSLDVKLKQQVVPFLLRAYFRFLQLKKYHCGGIYITDDYKFCSLSPEIFIIHEQNRLSTFPIKGTGTQYYLENSNKEKAELAMVTDLLRNDLGQITQKVELLNERFLREEAGFFHARSGVRAFMESSKLKQPEFLQLFPAGSVTGAPKKRVSDFICELESFDRAYFTGSLGVQMSESKAIYNLLIRTLFFDSMSQVLNYPVGVGITNESDPQEEWSEILQKTQLWLDLSR